jgi:nucleotide-binding universal stress UspA family protein
VKIVSAMEIPYAPTTETWVLPDSYYPELERVAKEQAEASVKDAVERIGSRKTARLEITAMIKSGPAREVILDEAESWDADLIVLGSHGYNGWRRFLLGSVSHAVAGAAEYVWFRRSRAGT